MRNFVLGIVITILVLLIGGLGVALAELPLRAEQRALVQEPKHLGHVDVGDDLAAPERGRRPVGSGRQL